MLKTPELAMPRTNKVTTVCNGRREVWADYEEAKAYFLEIMMSTDGEEHERAYILKLSITLDTLTARILKLSSDSQSGIEPTPFYSWWNPADCRADPAAAPVAHKISPDHRF